MIILFILGVWLLIAVFVVAWVGPKIKFHLMTTVILLFGLNTKAQTPTSFQDTFVNRLDTSKWAITQWKSADTKSGVNIGAYVPEAIDFSTGMLRIAVIQSYAPGSTVVISKGGEIQSKQKFGYGTYEFIMRMSSTAITPNDPGQVLTGAVSSGFLYNTNSESEIDVEFLGDKNRMFGTNWCNPNPLLSPSLAMKTTTQTPNANLGEGFHTYAIIWSPTSVEWTIDGVVMAKHTDHVPSAPAFILIQHRGTNSPLWGGTASIGVTRYLYVKSVSFVPAATQVVNQ